MSWFLAILLKPFFIFAYAITVRFSEIVTRLALPDGRLKEFLLKRR